MVVCLVVRVGRVEEERLNGGGGDVHGGEALCGGVVQQWWRRWDDEDGGGSWQHGCYGGTQVCGENDERLMMMVKGWNVMCHAGGWLEGMARVVLDGYGKGKEGDAGALCEDA